MYQHPARLLPGMVLGERYQIVGRLGEGGMSRVYLAEDLKLPGKQWAVKETVMQANLTGSFRAEAELLIKLSHARLPRITDYFQDDRKSCSYLVMDYIRGETLNAYFRKQRARLSSSFLLRLCDQLLDVLDYLHVQDPPIVFRDLKPSNIMLTEDLEVRLIDFGIARSYKTEQPEDTVLLGTAGFAAPEQYGGGQTDARTDLYALGAILLFLASGGAISEWNPGAEKQLRVELPKYLVRIIRRLLQRLPEDRYSSAQEVKQVLSAAVQTAEWNQTNKSSTESAGTLVTAVLGAFPGAGATHTSIVIGHYLAKKKGKVAIVEMGAGITAFSRIQEAAGGGRINSSRSFSINGIDFWRQTTRKELISLLGGGYDAVVLDLGMRREPEMMEEFLRSHVPVVVGSAAEWRQQELLGLARFLDKHKQPGRVYVVPLASPSAVSKMKKMLNSDNVLSIPVQSDAFDLIHESEEAIRFIYQGLVQEKSWRKKFRFARG